MAAAPLNTFARENSIVVARNQFAETPKQSDKIRRGVAEIELAEKQRHRSELANPNPFGVFRERTNHSIGEPGSTVDVQLRDRSQRQQERCQQSLRTPVIVTKLFSVRCCTHQIALTIVAALRFRTP